MPIKRPSIENLKSRVNILDVAGKYTNLKKRGHSYVGLSPFTKEKTPSFTVDPLKNVYYCFSSNQGGDVISFVQQMEKLEFYEAVEALAERYNVPLEYEEGSAGAPRLDRSLKKELLEIHLYAAEFFQKAFLFEGHAESDAVRKYWTNERKFSLEVAKDFGVGYAPADSHKLLEQLLKKNFSQEALAQSGLYFNFRGSSNPAPASKTLSLPNGPSATEGEHNNGASPHAPPSRSDASAGGGISRGSSAHGILPGGFKPRFRGRLMIPLRDVQGNVIAFTGRKLPQTPTDDPAFEAKYVNSPETPLFKKGAMLFNFDRARQAVEKQGFFLMVEGQLDALRVSSSGYGAVIAPQGTAITPEQLTLIKRYDTRLRVFLDGDRAGQAAALRMLPMALAAELDVSFMKLPAGIDPDLFFREGGKLETLEQLTPMKFAIQALWPQEESAQARTNALKSIFELIAASPSAITHEAYLDELIRTLHLEPRSVHLEFEKCLQKFQLSAITAVNRSNTYHPDKQIDKAKPSHSQSTGNFNKNLTTAESELLLALVHFPKFGPSVTKIVEPEWLDVNDATAVLLNGALAEASEGSWDPPEVFERVAGSGEARDFLYGLLARPFPKNADPISIINDCLHAIHSKFVSREMEKLQKEVSAASDPARLKELQKKQQFYLNSSKKVSFLTQHDHY